MKFLLATRETKEFGLTVDKEIKNNGLALLLLKHYQKYRYQPDIRRAHCDLVKLTAQEIDFKLFHSQTLVSLSKSMLCLVDLFLF